MQDTPIHLNGPFVLYETDMDYTIRGRDGVPILRMSKKLNDGSGRRDRYPDGIIRSEQARRQEVEFVLAAMNDRFAQKDGR